MNSPPTPTAPTKSLRRSDIKQLRRRLTCSAIRVWQQYTDVEKRLNVTFVAAQKFEKALADHEGEQLPDEWLDMDAMTEQLNDLRADAAHFASLATWYKSGHEQLNQMIREADTYISWELTD